MAPIGFTPVFDSIIENHKLEKNVMAFYYSLDESEMSQISIGGYDKTKFYDPISWVPIVKG
jgi:hypothetical protein